MLPACNRAPDEYEWDWRVAFPYDNPACYQDASDVGSPASPM
jgi:hypothetical protein